METLTPADALAEGRGALTEAEGRRCWRRGIPSRPAACCLVCMDVRGLRRADASVCTQNHLYRGDSQE